MNCDICEKFTKFDSIFCNVEDLDGICFSCFDSVPNHIPVEQIRKFLKGEIEKNLNGL